jgi:ribonuclease HI
LGEPLKGLPQTNQRAELTAILRALEIAPSTQDVHIYTDSRYSIDCSEKWHKNWEKNGWKTSLGGDVVNKDVIQGILSKKREREELGSATKFTWVKGHNNDPGNVAADQLANQGADKKARNRNGFDVDSLLYDEIAE